MDATDKPKGKPKRHPRRRAGCIVLLVMLLAAPFLCYGAVWLFARFGGELATSGDIPIPVDSEFVTALYEDDGVYVQKHSFYTHPATPETVRELFIQLGISLTPIPLDIERENFIDYENYYGTTNFFSPSTLPQFIHAISVAYMTGYFNDMIEHCQDVRVYKDRALISSNFPNIVIPENQTAFVVTTCWVGGSLLWD